MSSSGRPSDPKPPPPAEAASGETEPFLARWSRRKSQAREVPPPDPAIEPVAAPQPEPIDLASLPSIESLTADSDFTVFLRPGVPDALRNAALQKLWRTEPSVVNYVPLVEYNWDFNAPGYGALKATDDVAKLARQVWGGLKPPADEPPATAESATPPQPPPAPPPDPPPLPIASSAPDASSTPELPRRKHGGALPT